MKAYIVTTGAVFGLVVFVHVWRVIEEGPRLLSQPAWVGATLIAAGLCFWAVWLSRRMGRL